MRKKVLDDPKTCANCAFLEMGAKDDAGYCHRYPPKLIPDEESGATVSYPVVVPSDWCGEWSRKCQS